MDILKHTFRCIGRTHTQILLIFVCPHFRKVFHLKSSFHQLLLDLIADQNVKAVGQFIGLGSDETWLDFIDCPHKLLQSDIPQLLRK